MRELTGHPGVDIVVDPVGADRVHGSLRSLAREGRLLIIGSTGGNVAQINVDDLMRNNLNVSGVGWGAFWARQPSNLQEQWAALLPLLQAGELQPVLGRRFPLEQASQALLELDRRRTQGKVLLDVRRDGPAGSQPGASEGRRVGGCRHRPGVDSTFAAGQPTASLRAACWSSADEVGSPIRFVCSPDAIRYAAGSGITAAEGRRRPCGARALCPRTRGLGGSVRSGDRGRSSSRWRSG